MGEKKYSQEKRFFLKFSSEGIKLKHKEEKEKMGTAFA